MAVLRVEALARQVDETREEAAERVAPDEQPHAPALAEVEDAERRLEELVLRDLEQLVARIRLQDLDERLVVVAARAGGPTARRPAAPCCRSTGDLPRARAVGGVGVEPEKAPLAGDLAGGVEPLHADVVEVRGPVDGRPRVGLGQGEQVLLAREPPHFGWQLREADRDRPLVGGAQDAEPGARHGSQHVLSVLGEHVVLAVADEGEVAVVHPLEQVASLGAVVGIDRGGLELCDGIVDALTHRRPVLDGGAHVTEHAADAGTEPLQLLGPSLAVDLDVDHRLGQPVLDADLRAAGPPRPAGRA